MVSPKHISRNFIPPAPLRSPKVEPRCSCRQACIRSRLLLGLGLAATTWPMATLFIRYHAMTRNATIDFSVPFFPVASTDSWEHRIVASPERPPVARDEFFRQPVSAEVLTEYFRFEPDGSDSRAALQPLWACQPENDTDHPQRDRHKLVFLHIPRAAGSTVRALLRAYAAYCQAGIAIVSHCIDLGIEYMSGADEWLNGKASIGRMGEYCRLQFCANRFGEDYPNLTRVSTQLLLDQEVDILAGHVPLGSGDIWMHDDDEEEKLTEAPGKAQVHYVAFFRHPLHKYVSQVRFFNRWRPNVTLEEWVQLVNQTSRTSLLAGRYHEKYSNYFMTPSQKDWMQQEDVDLHAARRVNLTLANLFSHRVLVGVVESMTESLEMLQFTLDRQNQLNSLFAYFSNYDNVARVLSHVRTNLTEQIVERIRLDGPLLAQLQELLKYEWQIYNYALRRHQQQYSLLKSQQKNLMSQIPPGASENQEGEQIQMS